MLVCTPEIDGLQAPGRVLMKSFVIAACVLVLAIAQTSVVVAKELAEYRAEADQYYDDGNYKKAYRSK